MLCALLGGVLIGLSALMLLLFKGRIAGICGIVFSLFDSSVSNNTWRWLFLFGLVIGSYLSFSLFNVDIPSAPSATPWLIALAGYISGMGTYLANGCTSGHGVCGIGRGSIRSIVATCTFMATGIFSVSILKHILS